MAVTIDATSSANGSVSVSSISWSHTVASDANCLYVLISLDGSGGTYSYDASATYNGVSMTRVHEGNTNQYLAVFRLLSPAAGTNTVQVSWTGATYPGAAAISLKGVATGTPEGTVSSSTNSSASSYSHTITCGTNDLILTFGSVNNNTSATASGSATSQVQSTAGAPYTLGLIGSASGGTSVAAGFSWPTTQRFSGATFSVAEASTPATASPGVAAVALEGQGVTATAGATASPGAGAIALAGQSVSATAGATAHPGPAQIVLAGAAVSASGGATASPGAAQVALAGAAVSASAGALASPGAAALELLGRQVSATAGSDPADAAPDPVASSGIVWDGAARRVTWDGAARRVTWDGRRRTVIWQRA